MRFPLSFALLLLAGPLAGQVSVSSLPFVYTQDFSANLPVASNTALPWEDNVYFPGWYLYLEGPGAAPATIRVNSVSTSGQMIHYRPSAGSTAGSLGGRPNDSTGAMAYGLRLVNNTDATITDFTLSYTGRQFSIADTDGPSNNQITVHYKVGATGLGGTGWTTISGLVFNSPHDDADPNTVGGEGSDINPNSSGNYLDLGPVTITGITWEPGQELWIRFRDSNSTGVDHGLSIDNVSFSAIPEPATLAALFGLAALGLTALRRHRRR